jgi:hypothetical protein
MPVISRFLGIVISMHYREHGAPHFHARYGRHKISVEVQSGSVHGTFPPRALRHVREWAEMHRVELLERWEAAGRHAAIEPIAPLEWTMDYDVVEAQYVRDHVVRLRFRDGTCGEVDLLPELWGEVFEPLKDVEYFKTFRLDPELETLVWPNGADFAPEFLHDAVRVAT